MFSIVSGEQTGLAKTSKQLNPDVIRYKNDLS